MLIADAFRILSEANVKIASLGNDYVNQAGTRKQPKTLQQLIRVRQLYNIINRFVFINDAGTATAGTFGQNDAAVNRLLLQLKIAAEISSYPAIPNPIHSFITESCCGSVLPASGDEGDLLVFQGGVWTNFHNGTDGYSLVSTPTGVAWAPGAGGGIPSGGATGQFLKKNSNTSYDVVWDNIETTDINGLTATAAELNILDGVVGVTSTKINYLSNVNADIQTQLDSKLTGVLISGMFLVGNGSNVATAVTPTGDVTFNNAGVFDIAAGVIINADINAAAAIARTKFASGTANRLVVNNASGVMTDAAAITAARVLISDANGTPTHSTVTSTTLGYLDATSSIQTQINGKLSATITTPAQGDLLQYNGSAWINFPLGTSGQILTSNGSSALWGSAAANGLPTGGSTSQILRKVSGTNYDTEWHTLVFADISDVSTTNTEINLLSGLTATSAELNYTTGGTSNFQTQLNLKLNTSLAYNSLFVGNVSNTAGQLSAGLDNQVLMIISGAPTWQTFTPGTGSVTSVDVSGGTTGLSFTGGPVTTTGTITASGTLIAANGGTGQSSYAVGDILYASTTSALSKRTIGTAGQVLTVTGGVPTWETSVAVTDGDKGDITVSSSGTVWTIDNSAVTFAKIQNVPTASLVGRYSASTGVAQSITLGTGLSLDSGTGVLSSTGSVATLFKTENFTADGIVTVFTVAGGTVDQVCIVYVGGQQHLEGINFTVSGQDFTFASAPPSGSIITVTYFEDLLIGGGGGATAFTDLTDVPSTYTTYSLQSVRVNAAETGLEFYTPASASGLQDVLTVSSAITADVDITNSTGKYLNINFDNGSGSFGGLKVDGTAGNENYLIAGDGTSTSGVSAYNNHVALFSNDGGSSLGSAYIEVGVNSQNLVDILSADPTAVVNSRISVTPLSVSFQSNNGASYVSLTGNDLQININGANGTIGQVLTNIDGTNAAWADPSGGGGTWGSITGTLSSQTDLQSALDLKSNRYLTHNTQTGTTYTLVLTDSDTKMVEMDNALSNTLTVPLNSSVAFPVGTQIPVTQYGVGITTIAATGGVTINSSSGSLASAGQYSVMILEKRDTNEWYLFNGTASGGSGTVTSVTSANGDATVATTTTTPVITIVSAPKWTTARTLAGNSVDGSANVNFSNSFIVQGTADAGLTGAQFLGALSTGIVKNTTTTGVLSIATAGTDYMSPSSSEDISGVKSFENGNLRIWNVAKTFYSSILPGTFSANRNHTLPNSSGVILINPTSAIGDIPVAVSASSGTTLGVVVGVATGNVLISGGVATVPSYGKVGLTTHVSGVLPLANGGTEANLTASNGGIFYSTSSAGAILSGTATANKILLSGSSSAPTWSTSTIPTSAGATALKWLRSDGTNYILSTSTLAEGGVTANKILKSDGANWIASTETYAAPGTSGNVLVSDGANWTSASNPAYLLASGGTASAANTFTFNTANWLNYTGTFTNTASGQRFDDWSPIVTMRGTSADTYLGKHLGGSIEAKANSQKMSFLTIDGTFGNTGAFTSLTQNYITVGNFTNNPLVVNANGLIAGNTTNTQAITFNTAGANLSLSGTGGNAFNINHASIVGMSVNSALLAYFRPPTTFGFQILNGTTASSTATQASSANSNYTVSTWNGSAAVTDFFTTRATASTAVNGEFFYDIYTGTSASIPQLSSMWFRLKNNGDLLLGAGTGTTVTPSARLHVRGGGTTTGAALLIEASDGTDQITFLDNGDVNINRTITTAGTTGNQTINKRAGTINIAAAGTSVVLTNSLITANSIIDITLRSNDTTAKSVAYVATAGSATFYLDAAASAEVSIGFIVYN